MKAVELGMAEKSDLQPKTHALLEFQHGWDLYEQHLSRPEVAGGVGAQTVQRYRPIFNKFVAHAQSRGIQHWNDVTAQVVTTYLKALEKKKCADRTLYMEGTVLKQIMKWLAQEQLIPRACLFNLPLKKVRGTQTYCWTKAEVCGMIEHCRQTPGLGWLADVITALAHTGMRIGELAALRWSDITPDQKSLRVSNDPPGRTGASRGRRRTKSRRDRTIPIHANLLAVLKAIPRSTDGLVFRGPRGGRLKPDTVRTILIRDVLTPLKEQFPVATGERGFEHGRPHSFRHYFCSTAVNGGTPMATLMEWLGHQDSAMVHHYYHLHDPESQHQLCKLDFTGVTDSNVAAERTPKDLEASQSGRPARVVS